MIIAATSNFSMQIIYAFALSVLILAILLLKDRIFHRHPNKEERTAASKRFEERLLTPKIDELEGHFGHALPQDIKLFYSSREEILIENIEVVGADDKGNEKIWYIAYYQPVDIDNVRTAWPDTKEVFEFANDGCGNGYTVDPKVDDPPVMFYDHETGEWEKVADSFSKFMAMPRRQPE